MEEVHLMIFHIGPVQEFIASARRSRDLWFGSWLLSELSKAAALEIVQQNGDDLERSLIFPAPDSLSALRSDKLNVANRIVAITRKNPQIVGEAVQTRVRGRLRELSEDAFSRIGNYPLDLDSAMRQIDDLVELFWVSCPLDSDYSKARSRAEALMAARKVTRDFGPSTWAAPVDKSSLDGQREAVIPQSIYRELDDNKLRSIYGVRRGEKLCGVGLLKRLGRRGQEDDFLSTSHVAAQPLLGRLTEKDRIHVEQYKNRLRQLGISERDLNTVSQAHPVFGHTDGHLLYIERLREVFDGDNLIQAQQALEAFLNSVYGHDRPTPYYALLRADGDNMGKTISVLASIEAHKALSRALSGFAGQVEDIVERHQGSLIYAGGDDVLAMLPLHTVLDCARILASTFRDEMSPFGFVDETNNRIQPTLSVGIAVVHHLEPLSQALDLVRNAEKTAKSIPGKNALAVTLRKRAGSDNTVAGTWGHIDKRLEWFVNLYRENDIPTELAYDLRSMAITLPQLQDIPNGQDILLAELRRILDRRKVPDGSREIKQEIKERLVALWIDHGLSVEQLVNELIISREFAAVYELAEGKTSSAHRKGGESQ